MVTQLMVNTIPPHQSSTTLTMNNTQKMMTRVKQFNLT